MFYVIIVSKEVQMKKQQITAVLIIIFVAGAIWGLKVFSKYQSKSYAFANELKTNGLAIDKITIEGATSIIDVVTATGEGLKVKITHYGNGLFLKNVTDNLEKDKKNKTKIEPQPIYVAGNIIVAVYQEQIQGQVKAAVGRIYPGMQEY